MRIDKLVNATIAALEDVKARDIVVLDVKKMTSLFDKVIIASADSSRQGKALSNRVQEKLKALGARIYGVEGYWSISVRWWSISCNRLRANTTISRSCGRQSGAAGAVPVMSTPPREISGGGGWPSDASVDSGRVSGIRPAHAARNASRDQGDQTHAAGERRGRDGGKAPAADRA
jgi:ribosome silencing factor RsfS/YbeB/iojap